MEPRKYTFGPVPSRRLGFSLGIDIIPMKTCTYNCTYCQLFQTSTHTIERQCFVDKKDVLAEIKSVIESSSDIDYLTFSGSGEPTLNADLGWLIEEAKKIADIPVAVITNSSLLWMPDVRKDLERANLVAPSVDSVSENSWEMINRPAPGITLPKVLEGIQTFCADHQGTIWLEVMILDGVNDSEEEISLIAEFVNKLDIDVVQLNTVVRPPNEKYAKAITQIRLEEISKLFHHKTEIIAPFSKKAKTLKGQNINEKILITLSRRPCKPKELADSLGVNMNEIVKSIKDLEDQNKIIREENNFYAVTP